ncbi:MAG: hypothetical protein EPO09_14225 [Aquabacterium sp.]|uniref:OmpW/AlkL family protein n=1 Tax=Aquabacterium sp. TaxID=1872578 RepID=UPI0012147F98|nr:OmpW family outer membrane protein [Aquabacterium sp.]TAK92934.1 MAG: hypothetical protein EPO09_14225 [Aquabacterium sp.]
MNISSVARKATAIVVAMAAMGAVSTAYAQNSIFPTGWDNKVRDRLFMRFGYTQTFNKTKSEDARDITGPVATRQQLADAFELGRKISQACNDDFDNPNNTLNGGTNFVAADCYGYADGNNGYAYDAGGGGLLLAELDREHLGGLGTPPGIKAKTQKSVGTPTISLGYWLDDDYKWLVEAYVLAAPLKIKIYGDGYRDDGSPNSINGRHIATTKMLPPLVIGSYNFGDRRSVVRPFVGVGAMYAIFFDARTTSFFEEYQGGKTTLTTKNTFGFGPFVGVQSAINDDWHVNVSLGQVTLKATSTLVTSGTQIQSGAAVLSDYPAGIVNLINTGEGLWDQNRPDQPDQFTTKVMELVKRQRGTSDLGTYVREQKMKITSTILSVSLGRSF